MHGGQPAFLRVAAAALVTPLNLRLGGLALAFAAALGSWRLAAFAGGAYLVLVAVDVASPAFRARAVGEPPPRGGA
jgi:hypothetical protein